MSKNGWIEIAATRYPNMEYLGGDGNKSRCWVVLTRCEHSGSSSWRYALCSRPADAKELLTQWHANGCPDSNCTEQHSMWQLRAMLSGEKVARQQIERMKRRVTP